MRAKAYSLMAAVGLWAGTAGAQTTTYIGPNTSNADTWNNPANWDNGVPCGITNVVIPAGKLACAWSTSTPAYTGNLVISNNATVGIGWLAVYSQSYNALGTPGSTVIQMYDGSLIYMRMGGTPSIPAIQLMGNATMGIGESTQPSASPTFGRGINGPYSLTLQGNGGSVYLTTSNSFSGLVASSVAYRTGVFNIRAQATGSLGSGDVSINPGQTGVNAVAILYIDATNAMADTATLTLNGIATTRLVMNANDTIYSLFINGTQQVRGVYTSSGLGSGWMTGSGSLTVSTGAPTQPTGLKAVSGTVARSVRLDWTPVTDATGYKVKRSVTNFGYVAIGTTTATNYTDLDVFFLTNYHYVVSATNIFVESVDSAEATIALPVPGTVIVVR